jgi:hypothetical protein
MSDVRLNGPIPAPSEAQLDAGADRDPNARVAAPEDVQPPLTDDQINTSVDGNAPHTQPTGEFSGSEYPVDPANPNDIEPADQRLGNVANVDDLDEQGEPVGGKTAKGTARETTELTPAAAGGESPAARAEAKADAVKGSGRKS